MRHVGFRVLGEIKGFGEIGTVLGIHGVSVFEVGGYNL